MTKTIEIKGMRCGGCVKRVENALKSLGLDKVDVSLDKANAVVEFSNNVTDEKLKETVEELGFDVISVK